MSEVLHFQCPACAMPLRLPAAAAGVQGPCPRCAREIISPEPAKGLPARLAVPPGTEPAPPANPAARGTVSLSTLILSCVLVAILSFIAGLIARGPVSGTQPPRPEVPTSADSETALLDFLKARDPATRAALSLDPGPTDLPAGPIPFTEATPARAMEGMHVFLVRTPHLPEGFPVAVHQHGDIWRVDARTFAEFHDDYFQAFTADAAGTRGAFHLLVKPGPPAGPDEHFVRFDLSPPMPGRNQAAWVKKDSPAHARLREIFSENKGSSPQPSEPAGLPLVLALSKHETPARKPFLEIEEVVAPDWTSRTP